MTGRYDPLSGSFIPADLERSNTAAAESAARGSKNSYTKTIKMTLIKNKQYKFFFTYKHEDPETKEIQESDRSPVWVETFDIPNLTKAVQNLTLTPGSQSYGVKFDIDPTSIQEDVIIFESLTSDFATQTIVYTGTSTSVSILTTGATAFSPRWIKVRSRDKWDDLNISEVTAGPVTPFSADVDTTYTVANPGSTSASASIDPKDLSGFSLVSNISWAQSSDVRTAGYAIRWSTDNPSAVAIPLWEYASVSGIATTSFTATGLIPNTTYYYQVASSTPYDLVDWTGAASGTFIASDADGTAAGALARLKSYIAIGGASEDLFKIGTGISQSINLNADPLVSPPLTAGTYHGIILNKSATNVGNNFWLTTGQFRVGNPTEFMYWNGTNLYLTGNINATGGKFTGNIQLAIPTGGTTSGTLYAGANPTSGARVRLSSEGIFAYNSTSTNNATGLTFSLQQATGQIDAREGTVGGWTLSTTGLSSTNNNTRIESSGNLTLGNQVGSIYPIVRLSADDPTYRLWIGSNSGSTAPFRVTKEGVLYAQGAVIGLGAGSTIPGYATTDALSSYVTNSALTTTLGNYATNANLSSQVGTKNTTFYTTDFSYPSATKAGDLWINGGDNNEIYTSGSAGTGSWTKRTNGAYATKVALDTKLSAGGYAIAVANNQITNITSNGIYITQGTFKISNTTETAPNTGGFLLLNSAGMTAYNGTKTTFAISSSGSASFSGSISASTFDGGSITIGVDEGSTGYINTQASKNGVTTMVIKAIGHASTSNSGWTTSCYPYSDGVGSLGNTEYRWNNLYINGNANFASGTTYRINSSGDAFLNGYGVSGGYGVTSNWSPRENGGYSLGISSRRWSAVWADDSTINTSDFRLKKDIVDSQLGLNFINLLRPISYKWKKTDVKEVFEETTEVVEKRGDNKIEIPVSVPKVIGIDENGKSIIETTSREGARDHYGFVAQEVKQALDEIGTGDLFAGWVLDDHTDPESRQNLRYTEFISPMVKAIQELSDMVESLQQEVNTLKGI